MISFVWAEDQNHSIGYEGHLPWSLPADLKHFKEQTMNHPILMGRKTFDSLPKILPGRIHLILSRDQKLKEKYLANKQVQVFNSIDELFSYLDRHQDEEICAIGGRSIFKILNDKVDCLKKTEIDASFEADTQMPFIDYSKFELIKKEAHRPDERNLYPYTFLTYVRKEAS